MLQHDQPVTQSIQTNRSREAVRSPVKFCLIGREFMNEPVDDYFEMCVKRK